jgi:molecular chaperone GrpE (heat shock protein)
VNIEKNKKRLKGEKNSNQEIENYIEKFVSEYDEYDKKDTTDETEYEYEPYVKEGFKEGINWDPLNVGGKLKKSIKKTADKFNRLGNKIKKDMTKLGDKIKNDVMKGLGPMMDFFNDVNKFMGKIKFFFETLKKRFERLRDGFKYIGEGLDLGLQAIGRTIKTSFISIFDVVGEAGWCTLKGLTNLRICIFWYILDAIGATIYAIFVEFPVYVLKQITGIDIQCYVNLIHEYLDMIEDYAYVFTCPYRIFSFPDWVIEACYSCRVQEKAAELNYNFKVRIPRWFQKPQRAFDKSAGNFRKFIADDPN